jgi:hypothetical protein
MRERSLLTAQIEEVKREVSLRVALHPGKIASKVLSRDLSDLQIARLEDAAKTLIFVRDNREKIEAVTGVKIP